MRARKLHGGGRALRHRRWQSACRTIATACLHVLPVVLAARVAAADEVVRDVCVHDAARTDLSPPPLVLGCPVRGCCAGCSDDTPVDVRVQMEGDGFARITARVEGAPASAIVLQGAAARNGNDIELGMGTTTLSGLATAGSERPGRLRFQVRVDGRELRHAAMASPPATQPAPASPDAQARDAQPDAAEPGVDMDARQTRMRGREAVSPGGTAGGEPHDAEETEAAGPEEDPQWEVSRPAAPAYRIPARLTWTVTQLSGGNIIATDRYELRVQRCPLQKPRSDRIVLDGNDSADEAVLLLHAARDGACTGPELWLGRGSLYVGNVESRSGCPSEVTVFSARNAVHVSSLPSTNDGRRTLEPSIEYSRSRTPAKTATAPPTTHPASVESTGWTGAIGERLDIRLEQRSVVLPLRVLLLGNEQERVGLARRARFEIAVADMLLDDSRCGITVLGDVEFPEATLDETNISALMAAADEARSGNCRALGEATSAAALPSPGRVTLLYLPGWTGGAVTCVSDGMVLIGAASQPESLAHALGHLLGLQHAPELAADNLMQPTVALRRAWTEGQCFRASLEPRSILNRWKLRKGPIRTCDHATSRACPPLAWRDVLVPPHTRRAQAAKLQAWLECEDCAAEVGRVIQNETGAVGLLARTMREGASPARRDALRHHLTGLFLRLQAFAASQGKPIVTEDRLQANVERYLASFDLLVRSRAAQALSMIDHPEADQALAGEAGKERAEDKNGWLRRLLRRRN
ncbi:MAG TPA: hypothetical protein VEL28_19980 [Candidatus Binatia bacterium]|nr:hypothetical protein [Candidatus Binatia bacterium]